MAAVETFAGPSDDDAKYDAYVERFKENPSAKVYEPFQAGKLLADVALRRYVRALHADAKRLGYPRLCSFAKEMARGSIGLPPPTTDDPLHDAVGSYYGQLMEIERRILSEWYTPSSGTLKQKAKRISKSVVNFKKAVDRMIAECQGWLKARGF